MVVYLDKLLGARDTQKDGQYTFLSISELFSSLATFFSIQMKYKVKLLKTVEKTVFLAPPLSWFTPKCWVILWGVHNFNFF